MQQIFENNAVVLKKLAKAKEKVIQHPVNIGDCYRAYSAKADYWIVLSFGKDRYGDVANLIGLKDGAITRTMTKSVYSLQNSKIIGNCDSVRNIKLTIVFNKELIA